MHRIFTLLVVLAAVGCSGSDNVCTETADCFRGEVCFQGECVDPASLQGNGGANSGTNGSTNGSTNAPTNGSTNGSTNSGNGVPNNERCGFDQCIVDPFICACPDDGNDSFADSFHDKTVGCQPSEFVPLDKTIRARFCTLESADKYNQLYVPCDTNTFRLEVIMEPVVEQCDQSLMKMNLSVAGLSCDNQEQSSDIRCSWNSQGQFVAEALIRPSNSVGSLNITVHTEDREDVDFVYDLTVRVTE